MNRRRFLQIGAGAAAASSMFLAQSSIPITHLAKLDKVLAQPVLKRELFFEPVKIESVELVRYEKNFIVRVRSTEGAEGHAVRNNVHMVYLYPILLFRHASLKLWIFSPLTTYALSVHSGLFKSTQR